MCKLLIYIVLILTFFTAAQAQKNFQATVQVRVVSTKDTPATQMGPLLEKQLGDLVDVDVTQSKPDYSLYVFLEKIPSNGPAFYAFTYSFYRAAECTYKNSIVEGKVVRTDCRSLVQVSTTAFLSEAQIGEKATQIANLFNQAIIDPDRKAYQLNREKFDLVPNLSNVKVQR